MFCRQFQRTNAPKNPVANGPTLSNWVLFRLNPSSLTIEGRNNATPYTHVPFMNAMMKIMMTWGERMERKISLPLNLSEGLIDGRSRSRRAIMSLINSVRTNTKNMTSHTHSFCSEVRNLECLGVEGISENPARPIQIVNNPSWKRHCQLKCYFLTATKRTRINIQAHPGLPPIPSMFWIAAANRPENAPESCKFHKEWE